MRSRIGLINSLAVATLLLVPALSQAQEPSTGKTIYEQNCTACHGSDGSGRMRGVPDFTATDSALNKPEKDLVQSVINGVSGGGMFGMPARGGNSSLSDEDIVNVVRYMKATFRKTN